MDKEDLLKRLSDIEWDDFEAKKASVELPKSVWETVSAFANSAGGWLVLGVSQIGKKFEVTGVDDPEKMEQDFISSLRGKNKFYNAMDDDTFNQKLQLVKDGKRSEKKVGEKYTKNQKLIIENIIENQSISAKELSEIVGISARKIEVNIAKLKAKSFIKREGPDKGGKWIIISENSKESAL